MIIPYYWASETIYLYFFSWAKCKHIWLLVEQDLYEDQKLDLVFGFKAFITAFRKLGIRGELN